MSEVKNRKGEQSKNADKYITPQKSEKDLKKEKDIKQKNKEVQEKKQFQQQQQNYKPKSNRGQIAIPLIIIAALYTLSQEYLGNGSDSPQSKEEVASQFHEEEPTDPEFMNKQVLQSLIQVQLDWIDIGKDSEYYSDIQNQENFSKVQYGFKNTDNYCIRGDAFKFMYPNMVNKYFHWSTTSKPDVYEYIDIGYLDEDEKLKLEFEKTQRKSDGSLQSVIYSAFELMGEDRNPELYTKSFNDDKPKYTYGLKNNVFIDPTNELLKNYQIGKQLVCNLQAFSHIPGAVFKLQNKEIPQINEQFKKIDGKTVKITFNVAVTSTNPLQVYSFPQPLIYLCDNDNKCELEEKRSIQQIEQELGIEENEIYSKVQNQILQLMSQDTYLVDSRFFDLFDFTYSIKQNNEPHLLSLKDFQDQQTNSEFVLLYYKRVYKYVTDIINQQLKERYSRLQIFNRAFYKLKVQNIVNKKEISDEELEVFKNSFMKDNLSYIKKYSKSSQHAYDLVYSAVQSEQQQIDEKQK